MGFWLVPIEIFVRHVVVHRSSLCWYNLSIVNEKQSGLFMTMKTYVGGYLASLRDVRNLGVLIFFAMVLLVSWSSARAIQTNYALQKQLERLRQENEVAKLENSNIKLRNQYYNTPQYLEVAARQNLGLAAPGETVLLVSKEVALKNVVKEVGSNSQIHVAKELSFWQKNLRDWANFFLHRS